MALFKVEINTGGDAFEGTDDELTRILDTLIEKIKVRGREGEPFALMDYNGNRVGTAWAEEDDADVEGSDYGSRGDVQPEAYTTVDENYREHITLRHDYTWGTHTRTQVYWAGGARIGIRKTKAGARKLADRYIEKARAAGQL